jgi:5-epi-alpha-selinene synthase
MKHPSLDIPASSRTAVQRDNSHMQSAVENDMHTQLEAIQLPELWCPFPSRISPDAEAVHTGTCDWLERFGLGDGKKLPRNFVTDVSYLAARYHPDLSYTKLQLVSDWYTWFFYQDDLYHETRLGSLPDQLDSLHSRLLSILRGATPASHDVPLVHALYELWQRWHQLASPAWLNHFTYHISEFLAAMAWEATNRLHGVPPSLTAYLRLRPITGGLAIEQLIAELTENVVFPSDVVAYPVWQHLRLLADHAVCWLNDLVSLNKELQQNDIHNLVLVLQHEYQIPLKEAVQRAAAMHDSTIAAFIELASKLPACDELADLQRYVEILQVRIRGNYDWTYEARRYQH